MYGGIRYLSLFPTTGRPIHFIAAATELYNGNTSHRLCNDVIHHLRGVVVLGPSYSNGVRSLLNLLKRVLRYSLFLRKTTDERTETLEICTQCQVCVKKE